MPCTRMPKSCITRHFCCARLRIGVGVTVAGTEPDQRGKMERVSGNLARRFT